VEYAEATAGLFGLQSDIDAPDVVVSASPARRLRDVSEPLAMHAVWSPTTNERLAALGLDFLGAYVGGRASSLGRPVGAVVAAAFAWFEPGMISGLYDLAARTVGTDELIGVRDEATTASLRTVLDGEDVAPAADVLADAVEAADGTGRPLFSGLRGKGRPVDAVQRLWWACDLVREHRGDSHVAAAAVNGVGPVEMNILTERWLGMPLYSYTATRGWPETQMHRSAASLEDRGWLHDGDLTDEGRAARAAIEARTGAQEQSVVDALGPDLDALCARLARWSDRCVAAATFPTDIRKRAAG
jgi:hypothetical protein